MAWETIIALTDDINWICQIVPWYTYISKVEVSLMVVVRYHKPKWGYCLVLLTWSVAYLAPRHIFIQWEQIIYLLKALN